MSKIYMLRGQGHGVMTDRAFPDFPTPEQAKEALGRELALHGFHEGKPRKLWVKVHEVVLEDGKDSAAPPADACWHYEGELTQAEVDEMMKAGPPGTIIAGVGQVTPEGTGTVTNPGDPGYEESRETMTISADDVAEIDASTLAPK